MFLTGVKVTLALSTIAASFALTTPLVAWGIIGFITWRGGCSYKSALEDAFGVSEYS